MMIMNYKGYCARIQYSPEDKCLFGEVLGINDMIDFEGENVAELEQDFHDAIDFYLESCEKRGKAPNKPFADTETLAIPRDLLNDILDDACQTILGVVSPLDKTPTTATGGGRKPAAGKGGGGLKGKGHPRSKKAPVQHS